MLILLGILLLHQPRIVHQARLIVQQVVLLVAQHGIARLDITIIQLQNIVSYATVLVKDLSALGLLLVNVYLVEMELYLTYNS